MSKLRPLIIAALMGCLAPLGACSSGQSSSDGLTASIDRSISSAMDKAQAKLRDEPITVSNAHDGSPKVQITPAGDFIVGGRTVAITPAQRAALLAYRAQLVAVASAGIEVGKQGAALGMHAASEAIAGAFSGKSDKEIEAKVKTQTSGIRAAAVKICDRLPAMLAEQQKLAAILPAFKPYATMTQTDIADCRSDALKDDSD